MWLSKNKISKVLAPWDLASLGRMFNDIIGLRVLIYSIFEIIFIKCGFLSTDYLKGQVVLKKFIFILCLFKKITIIIGYKRSIND